MPQNDLSTSKHNVDFLAQRRSFLARCGKFAVVTPPAITLLLSTSLHSGAIAQSSGRDCDHPSRRD